MAAVAKARRLVIKIGSALLVDRYIGMLRSDWLQALADDVARVRARGTDARRSFMSPATVRSRRARAAVSALE